MPARCRTSTAAASSTPTSRSRTWPRSAARERGVTARKEDSRQGKSRVRDAKLPDQIEDAKFEADWTDADHREELRRFVEKVVSYQGRPEEAGAGSPWRPGSQVVWPVELPSRSRPWTSILAVRASDPPERGHEDQRGGHEDAELRPLERPGTGRRLVGGGKVEGATEPLDEWLNSDWFAGPTWGWSRFLYVRLPDTDFEALSGRRAAGRVDDVRGDHHGVRGGSGRRPRTVRWCDFEPHAVAGREEAAICDADGDASGRVRESQPNGHEAEKRGRHGRQPAVTEEDAAGRCRVPPLRTQRGPRRCVDRRCGAPVHLHLGRADAPTR